MLEEKAPEDSLLAQVTFDACRLFVAEEALDEADDSPLLCTAVLAPEIATSNPFFPVEKPLANELSFEFSELCSPEKR